MNYRLCEKKCQWHYYGTYQEAQEYRQCLVDWSIQVGAVQVRCPIHGWAEVIKGGRQCLECLIEQADLVLDAKQGGGVMIVPEHKKHEYWNHFIAQWAVEKMPRLHGMTGPKLRKIKPAIWQDEFFWSDVILRHNALDDSPEHLREYQPENYDHCTGNFWGMIVQTMIERGMIK